MTTSGEYTIVDFEEAHLADVLSICKQELGVDYHSEADFRKYLGDGRERLCMVMLDNQKAVYAKSRPTVQPPWGGAPCTAA